LKEVITYLLENEEFAYSMGRKARETVEEEYSFYKIIPQYLNLYSKLLYQNEEKI